MLRNSIISPLAVGTKDNAPPGASQMVLIDERDRRLVLVELRLSAGKNPEAVRQDFLTLFADVFNTADPPPYTTRVARHYMRCVLSPDEIQRLVGGGARSARLRMRLQAVALIYHVWPDLCRRRAPGPVVDDHQGRRSRAHLRLQRHRRRLGVSATPGSMATIPTSPQYATLTADAVKDLHRDFILRDAEPPPSSPDRRGRSRHPRRGHHRRMRPTDHEPVAHRPQRADRAGLSALGATHLGARAPPCPGSRRRPTSSASRCSTTTGRPLSSVIIEALDYVRKVNSNGRELQIHGVNLSLGCGWLPKDYAAGQSPLCRELDLLVGTGVVAVVSAGNSGAGGTIRPARAGTCTGSCPPSPIPATRRPRSLSDRCTVTGPTPTASLSTRRRAPPWTAASKPDLVAPGERITSAATGQLAGRAPLLTLAAGVTEATVARYIEDSGTSMAAAHVSGVIAALLSARTEYIGQPDNWSKDCLPTPPRDLGRHQFFQGAGLVDLMRALSST